MVGCGQTSATWLPSTMRLPPLTRPSGSRERRSSAFIREDATAAAPQPASPDPLDLSDDHVAVFPHRRHPMGLEPEPFLIHVATSTAPLLLSSWTTNRIP